MFKFASFVVAGVLLNVPIALPGRAQTNEIVLVVVSPLDYQVFQRQTLSSGKITIETFLNASTRGAAGWRVPWFVAQASYHDPGDTGSPELRAAQKSLVTDGAALAGPNTDDLGPKFREKNGRGVHFNARGLQRHGELWAERVGAWLEQQRETEPASR